MRKCSNCGKTHGSLKRYMWNTRTPKGNIAKSHEGLLCEKCARSLGAWQTMKQDLLTQIDFEATMDRADIEDTITIGTPEEAYWVSMSLTDEDIERLEREEEFPFLD